MRIRSELRKKKLHNISVERVLNVQVLTSLSIVKIVMIVKIVKIVDIVKFFEIVSIMIVQGKQYRAIFISTVRTRATCFKTDENDMKTLDYG